MIKKIFILNTAILFATTALVSAVYFFGWNFLKSQSAIYLVSAEEKDTAPPKLIDIKISDVAASSTMISWTTDEKADSLVNYSLDKNYGISRSPLADHTAHKIFVDNLKSKTTYYFRVISSDASGNQAISGDYNFTTLEDLTVPPLEENQTSGETTGETPAEQKQQEEKSSQKITEDVIDMLEKITNPEDLLKVQDAVESIAGGELNPPAVLGAAPEIEVGSDYAVVKWVTDRKSNSILAIAAERDYRPDSDNPYSWKQGEPVEMTIEHEVRIGNLAAATTYHYQIQSKPELGPEGKSKDFTFKTKSILPEIYNLKIMKVEEDAATLTWNTNIPTKAIVEYTNLSKKETKLAGSSNPVTTHLIRISDLIFDTTYQAIVHAENEYGEKADSFPITFTTVRDIVAPIISKINTESTIYPGSEGKIQTIISWETDETSMCQFFYQEGILAKKDADNQPKETDYTTKHVQVVTAFTQATVYKYWIKCNDDAGNEISSDSYTILTPAQEQSIIDLIIGNFESTFGWLKKK